MSQLLHEVFDELAAELGVQSAPPGAAGAAWRNGRRRVVRRRVGASALTALAVLIAVALVWQPGLPRALDPAGRAQTATGHPLRVTKPWFVSALAAKGPPLAGLALSAPDHDPYSRSTWLAIDEAGGVHRLPAGSLTTSALPALSPDGRLVAYGDQDSNQYVVRNVVDGTRQVVAGLTAVMPDTQTGTWSGPAVVDTQVPSFWSPDGRHLATRVTTGDGTQVVAVISGDGAMTTLPWPGTALLAGWVDNTRVLAVDGGAGGDGADRTVSVATIDVATGVRSRLPNLQPERPFGDTELSQWSPTLSPDGRRLAMSRRPADDNPSQVAYARFNLATGVEQGSGEYATEQPILGGMIGTLLQWRGDDLVATFPTRAGTLVGVGAAPPSATMLVDPRLDVEVLLISQQALAGPAHGSVWGHSTSWFVWRWRECALALLALGAVTLLIRRSRLSTERDRSPQA